MDQESCSRYNFNEFEYENQLDGTSPKFHWQNFHTWISKLQKKIIELSPLKSSHYAVYKYAWNYWFYIAHGA